ncbi:MAG: hypothetical protein ACRD3O_01235 [Terriglobia bacterium]
MAGPEQAWEQAKRAVAMDLTDAQAFIDLVSREYERREALLPGGGDGAGYDQWVFTDLPFLHDVCILYLVAVRHHIDRRLLFLAACALPSVPIMLRPLAWR